MFLALQFPFADLRSFLPEDTCIVSSPPWPFPKSPEFLRYAGPATRRLAGGIPEWDAEESFCSLARGLRFPNLETISLSSGSGFLKPACKFRRLFFDGRTVGRAEIGLRLRPADPSSPTPVDPQELTRLLQSLLQIPVHIPTGQPPHQASRLGDAAKPLARLFLNATTKQRKTPPTWWVTPGDPILLAELPHNLIDTPIPGERVFSLNEYGARISHLWLPSDNERIGVWLMRTEDRSPSSFAFARRLRICLLRWHSEKECLKNVIRSLSKGRILVTPDHESTARLQEYFNRATRELSRERLGLPTTAILEHAWKVTELVTPGEGATLVEALGNCRRQVASKVQTFIARESLGTKQFVQLASNVYVKEWIMGDKVDKKQTIGAGARVGVNIQADTVTNSLNRTTQTLQQANTGGELKKQLEALSALVNQLVQEVPAEKALHVARDLDALVNEAVTPSPRRKWYELSADGLIKAAKTCARLATPMAEAVKAVLALIV